MRSIIRKKNLNKGDIVKVSGVWEGTYFEHIVEITDLGEPHTFQIEGKVLQSNIPNIFNEEREWYLNYDNWGMAKYYKSPLYKTINGL